MGIYGGLAPDITRDAAVQQMQFIMALMDARTREEKMRDHAFAEARREVASWWSGELYQWCPFEE